MLLGPGPIRQAQGRLDAGMTKRAGLLKGWVGPAGCAEDSSPNSAEDAGFLRQAQDRFCLSPWRG